MFENFYRSCTIYNHSSIFFFTRSKAILDTKEAILKKARKLFAKHGFDGVSIRTICDKVPCNVSAISYHFGSKEGLYRECFQVEGQDTMAIIRSVLTPPKDRNDFESKLTLFMYKFFENCFKNRETILIIGKDIGSKSAMESMEKLFSEIPDGVWAFLQEAQNRKILRKDLDLKVMCSLLINPLFMQILFLEQSRTKWNFSDSKAREAFVDQLLSICFSGIYDPPSLS